MYARGNRHNAVAVGDSSVYKLLEIEFGRFDCRRIHRNIRVLGRLVPLQGCAAWPAGGNEGDYTGQGQQCMESSSRPGSERSKHLKSSTARSSADLQGALLESGDEETSASGVGLERRSAPVFTAARGTGGQIEKRRESWKGEWRHSSRRLLVPRVVRASIRPLGIGHSHFSITRLSCQTVKLFCQTIKMNQLRMHLNAISFRKPAAR